MRSSSSSLPARATGSRSGQAHERRLRVKPLHIGVALVLLVYALRYVVDVRVSVRWRQPPQAALSQQQQRQQQQRQRRHCRNSCWKARDGVCDEGRPHRLPAMQEQQEQQQRAQGLPAGVSAVHCDLGTDCDDCGAWYGQQADNTWPEQVLPIAFLASRNISVRSRPTSALAAPLNVTFAFTDPEHDVDVSRHVQMDGLLEVGISQIFYHTLAGRCAATGPGGLVADVGANFGWQTVLAAWLGCSVVAWEPVPAFRAFLSWNLARNGLAGRVAVRAAVVADPPGSKQTVVVPNRGIWGTAGIGGANVDPGIQNDGPYQKVEVVAESLDEVLAGRHVALLKVDVEGAEPGVMATATRLLANGAIDNVVLEYSPGVLERAARWDEMSLMPGMLLDLVRANFSLLHLDDGFTRVMSPGRALSRPLPLLRTISAANLAYDLWDAAVFHTGWLDAERATPYCQEMIELRLDNQGMPERLHPKSLHSMLGHNTNVWASRQTDVVGRLAGKPVGIIPLDTPTNASWFPPAGSSLGLGGTSCPDLAQEFATRLRGASNSSTLVSELMAVLIGRRCRCTHGLPCKKHEAAVEACTRSGRTPFVDL